MDDQMMPSVLDREVEHPDGDAFGHRDFAAALRSLVESKDHQPPFSIGLLGPWGTGKSTIKTLYIHGLEDDASKDGGKRRSSRIRTVTFNAWRHGGDNIKRALLRHVFLDLGGESKDLTDALHNQIKRDFLEARPWREITKDAYEKLVWNVVPIAVVVVIFAGALWLAQTLLKLDSDWAKTFLASVLALFSGWVTKYLSSTGRFSIPRYSKSTRIELPRSSAEEYEELLVGQINKFKAASGRDCERLVIFVDDLDRLSADEMVNGLDAIRTFMEIPKGRLPSQIGVVFVISCDEDRVAAALASRRWQRVSSELPGAVLTLSDARRYLDRIFQFRLEIPPFPKQDMREFVSDRFRTDCAGVVADLETRGVRLVDLVDRMIHVGVSSPRNALQILNAFVQTWWLATRREFEGSGTSRRGGLSDGAVTQHPLALAALCALRVDFPDFYRQMEEEPDLLGRATAVLVRGEKLDVQPETTQHALSGYFSGDDTPEIKEDHRALRTFLASLQGLDWPDALQPLLLLTQDAITRSYGDGAIRIYRNFVSGDSKGVLTEMGRDKDSRALNLEETRLLSGFTDDLVHETEARKDNAAVVLADLAPRLDPAHAGLLMTPLCDQLGRSVQLRSRVGLDRIAGVVGTARPATQQHLASVIIGDTLREEGDTRLTLPSLQTPSLEQAVDMAQTGLEIVFGVRDRHHLGAAAEVALVAWLRTRRVSIGKQEHIFPFAALEKWVSEREDRLLLTLRADYTDQLIGELEAGRDAELDLPEALRRCRTVLEELAATGQEDRTVFWTQVTRLVHVPPAEAVDVAIELARPRLRETEKQEYTGFVHALVGRLGQEAAEPAKWQLDRARVASDLNVLVNQNPKAIGKKCHPPLGELITAYGRQEKESELFSQLCASATRVSNGILHGSLQELIPEVETTLPQPTVEWIGSNFASFLNEEEQSSVVAQFAAIASQTNLAEETAERYAWFISALGDDGFANEHIQQHASALFAQLPGRHNNQNNVLTRIFPTAVRFLDHEWPENAGQRLQSLLSNARGNVEIYCFLHKHLKEHWPPAEPEIPGFTPESIYEDAKTFAQQHSTQKGIHAVLESISSMVLRGTVPAEKAAEVVQAAAGVWPSFPVRSMQVMLAHSAVPPAQAVADLADHVDFNDEESCSRLLKLWTHIARNQNPAQRSRALGVLLSKNMVGTDDDPDAAVSLWISASGDDAQRIVRETLKGDDINDESRQRAWEQAVRRAEEFGSDFFVDQLPGLLGRPDCPEMQKAIIRDQEHVSSLFSGTDAAHALGKALLDGLVAASSVELKTGIAQWIQAVNAEGVLTQVQNREDLADGDVKVLHKVFPSHKKISRLYEDMQKADSDEAKQ